MAHPSVTTEMIKIHLIVITDLLFVMSMRISAEHHEIISYRSNKAIIEYIL